MVDLVPIESAALQAPGVIQQALNLLQRRRTRGEALGHKRKNTASVYRDAWANFAAFLKYRHTGDKGDFRRWAKREYTLEEQLTYLEVNLRRVTHHDVQAYQTTLLNLPTRYGVGLASSTIIGRLSALSFLFQAGFREGVLPYNPAGNEYVDRPSKQCRRLILVPSLEEVRRFLRDYPAVDKISLRNRMLFKTFAWTGIRREEASELYLRDFYEVEEGIAMTIHRGKGDKDRNMLLHRNLESDFAYYIEEVGITGPLFPAMYRRNNEVILRNKPLAPGSISHLLLEITEKILGKPYSPHKLRHFFATATYEAGASIEDIQEALGHEDPRTTRGYIKRKLTRKRSVAELLDLKDE